MIRMTNGSDTLFVFDSAVRYYKSIGYVPVTENAAPVIVEEIPDAVEEETPVTEEPATVEFEPNDEGRYVCPYCGKDYSTRSNLMKHIESKHPDEL